jgi:ADP-ribosylglycohydrolase
VKDRFVGCIIGQAVGDALGFPVEGHPPAVTAGVVADGPLRLRRHPSGVFSVGQYTDDTQMMRAVLESLVELQVIDPANIAARFVTLWRDGTIVGRGRATTEAVHRLMRGVPWTESGTPAPRAGNGSAMRTAPIGLFHHDHPRAAAESAADVSRITHSDPRCLAGAAAVSTAISWNLHHDKTDLPSFLNDVADLTRRYDGEMAGLILDRLPNWLAGAETVAVDEIRRAGLAPDRQPDWSGISPFVMPTVLAALYAFLRTPKDWMASVRWVISLGGDVDTTGAITGAISGAFNGIDAIPQDLAHQVNDRGRHGYAYLADLARRLWELRAG